MKKTLILSGLIVGLFATSCGNEAKEDSDNTENKAPKTDEVVDVDTASTVEPVVLEPEVVGPNYEEDFANFVALVLEKDSAALIPFFPNQGTFEDAYWHMQKDMYQTAIPGMTYADLEDDVIGGDEAVTPVKVLKISLTEVEEDVFYLLLNFIETEDGLKVLDMFVPEPPGF
jgi:hypothetical protein